MPLRILLILFFFRFICFVISFKLFAKLKPNDCREQYGYENKVGVKLHPLYFHLYGQLGNKTDKTDFSRPFHERFRFLFPTYDVK